MNTEAVSGHVGSAEALADIALGSSDPGSRGKTYPPTPRAEDERDDTTNVRRPHVEEYEPYKTPAQYGRNRSNSPRRKSITFTRDTTGPKTRTPIQSRHPSVETPRSDLPGQESSRAKLKSKMRAIGLPLKPLPHARARNGNASGDLTSSAEGAVSDSEDDANAGMTAVDTPEAPQRRARPRPTRTLSQTAPNTPLQSSFRAESFSTSGSPLTHLQAVPQRRASTTDVPEAQRDGYSDHGGRTRLPKHQTWRRRGSAWLHASHHYGSSGPRRKSKRESSDNVRPNHFRRLTQLAGSTSAGDGSPAAPRMRRTPMERWRDASNRIKDRIAANKKAKKKAEKSKVDILKSAQLVSGMLAGSPAAMILASNFQRDEHGRKKVPVLLEQLKVEVPDSTMRDDSDRRQLFCIRLEYGSGRMRMRWEIWRSFNDIYKLHTNFKLLRQAVWITHYGQSQPRIKLPNFPFRSVPFPRDWRSLSNDAGEEEDDIALEGAGTEQASVSAAEARHYQHQPRSSRRWARFSNMTPPTAVRNVSSAGSDHEGPTQPVEAAKDQRDAFMEFQRRKLETYLRELIRFVLFSQGSNRLCKFLEISTLGINLAAEAGYHGKEGLLSLTSDMRRDIKGSRNPRQKWFLVRQSYIAFVETPESMSLLDVMLIDPDFRIEHQRPRFRDQQNPKDIANTAKSSAAYPKHHVIRMSNSERGWVVFARNDRQQDQFVQSIKKMKEKSLWSQPHRFDSFAPQRRRVFAEWLVDGRDYMWKVSRAIDNAQHVIYIHDWWLSPELFMRRPPAISTRWRLDRLLQRKAEQGVKIFVIMYKNIESAIPIDSTHSKNILLDIHPNVYVMRSPSNLKQNTFFWAHHEKVCVVDHLIGFCGGVDLCFGRWDTPEHRVVDDKPTGFEEGPFPRDTDHAQCWPGKDYSNARVLDFYDLHDPFEEMYDRRKVPRMPWHDIGMQLVGQPARDLARHFVQRWNYLLRNRKASRPIPCLLPPPDFGPEDLQRLDLAGSCEVQILRSACNWSLGTPDRTEHSIMNAYIKLIETSEHFIYIENQFFISSCMVDNTRIHNLVGDALVERITRAHQDGEDWLAVILIPLMPGFANPVNEPGGASVRLIMQCQYRSICRGETSIFGRLKAKGIQPEEYIRFYSLRAWGKIGPTKSLTTEQLYIHAKCMIVDDRQVIIGSANINERSQLGTRDSEVAAIVYDTDMIESVMAGEPYKVCRFAHTLRIRLMREHLGIDVDAIRNAEFRQHSASNPSTAQEEAELDNPSISSEDQLAAEPGSSEATEHFSTEYSMPLEIPLQDGSSDGKENVPPSSDQGPVRSVLEFNDAFPRDSDERNASGKESLPHGRDSVIIADAREVLVTETYDNSRDSDTSPTKQDQMNNDASEPPGKEANSQSISNSLPPLITTRFNSRAADMTLRSNLPPLPATDDTDIGGPPLKQAFSLASTETSNSALGTMRRPILEHNCMRDPLNVAFFEDTWHVVAENNTRIFRQVFRCNPDDEVKDWDDYEAFVAYRRRFDESMGIATTQQDEEASKARPPGTETLNSDPAIDEKEGVSSRHGESSQSSSKTSSGGTYHDKEPVDERGAQEPEDPENQKSADELFTIDEKKETSAQTPDMNERAESKISSADAKSASARRRRRATTKSSVPWRASDPVMSKADAEELLNLIQGHLVVFPYRWLEIVEDNSAWLYPFDQVSPLEIYD